MGIEECVGILMLRLVSMDTRFFEGAKAFWGMEKPLAATVHNRILSQWPEYEAQRNQSVSVCNQLKQYFHKLLPEDATADPVKSEAGSGVGAAAQCDDGNDEEGKASVMRRDGALAGNAAQGQRRKSTETVTTSQIPTALVNAPPFPATPSQYNHTTPIRSYNYRRGSGMFYPMVPSPPLRPRPSDVSGSGNDDHQRLPPIRDRAKFNATLADQQQSMHATTQDV